MKEKQLSIPAKGVIKLEPNEKLTVSFEDKDGFRWELAMVANSEINISELRARLRWAIGEPVS